MKNNVFAKAALALSAVALLAAPTIASAAASAPQPAAHTQQHAPRGPLTVSYYSGDPAQGGKLLKTVTLQPPVRSGNVPAGTPTGQPPKGPDGQAPQGGHKHHGHHGLGELKAQAPTGATYAVIKGASGKSRTIDLTKAPQDKTNK